MNNQDDYIIQGFRRYDADITKEYFYGYCRRAYSVMDARYQLHNKAGLDFYSLAHEYYLHLMSQDFRQLTDRPDQMKLSSYMYKGFWFVAMDALKAYRKELIGSATDADIDMLQYVRSADRSSNMMEQIAEAVSCHYKDRTMSHIAWSLFVLGFKQNEVAQEVGLTPAAVNQRYKKMMQEVITPFVIENYSGGLSSATMACSYDSREMSSPYLMDLCEYNSITKEPDYMENRRITPEFITTLRENEVFVFGSNLRGIHAGGAARMAALHFGAEMGKGVGIQGQSYAIPTMQGGVETIKPYVDDFINFAKQHPELHFLVTPIGCGIAGFEPENIAPLFTAARDMENVWLPASFL